MSCKEIRRNVGRFFGLQFLKDYFLGHAGLEEAEEPPSVRWRSGYTCISPSLAINLYTASPILVRSVDVSNRMLESGTLISASHP